jgi:hypothetical protein
MSIIPISLALIGVVLLVWAIRSFIFVRRSLADDSLPKSWRRRRFIAFVVGAVLAISTLWHAYPLNGGTAAGVPFMAAWFDAKGRDYVGAITLPAMLGDLVFWFLVPQIVLAFFVRKHFRSDNEPAN